MESSGNKFGAERIRDLMKRLPPVFGKMFSKYEDVLALVGVLCLGRLGCILTSKIFNGIYVYGLHKVLGTDLKKYGRWAVITGSTDGIGKAYAKELARRGLNIILISRSLEKLQATAEEIEKEFHVHTYIIQADFSGGRDLYKRIEEQLKNKEIGILVNNVGVMYDYPSLFANVPEEKLWQTFTLNIIALTMMTHLILPQMVKRKKGIIINMASMSSMLPLPLMAAYSASKAYVDWFSRALDYEYKNKGIIVQRVMPSYVSTNLTKFSHWLQRPSFICPSADSFASSAVSTIGATKRTTGYWTHGIQYWVYEHVPEWMWNLSSFYLLQALDDGTYKLEERKKM